MAEGNPILEQIKKDLENGYSKQSIIDELKRSGLYEGEVQSFFESQPEKKNFDSQSASQSDSEASQESPSDTDTSPQAEQSASDSSTDNQVAHFAKLDVLQSEYDALYQTVESIYDSSEKDEITDEDVDNFMGVKNEPNFFQKLFGIEPDEDPALEQAVGTRTINKVLLQANIEEVKELGETKEQTYERLQNKHANTLNEIHAEAMPDSEPLYNFKEGEDGTYSPEINYKSALELQQEFRRKTQFEEQMVAERAEDVASIQGVPAGRFMYDLGTGVMDLGYSFLTFLDTEAAQEGLYGSQFRTQASYAVAGVSQEEQEQGLYNNLVEGDFENFGKLFSTQLAQTTPQLAAQAAIAYATRGMGPNMALWSSSAFMGLSTFGRTYATTNGIVDPDVQFLMSLGDALVETASERVFASDVKALANVEKSFKGMSRQEIKNAVFKKGILSKELRDVLKQQGADVLSGTVEEGIEELMAGFGSAVIHNIANNEEINPYEIIDGMIVGFGMGGAASGKRATINTLSAGASSLGFGGIKSDLIKIRSKKQELAKELAKASTASEKAIIKSKIDELTSIELNKKSEMSQAYNEYSEEDAKKTLELNQKIKNNLTKMRSENITEEQKKTLTEETKSALQEIASIEANYGEVVANIREQREAAKNFNYGESGSVEIGEDTDTQGVALIDQLKQISKALGAKVMVHKDYDSMASEVASEEQDQKEVKQQLIGARGIYKSADGSIHILLPAAQENTAFHEAFHDIAKSVDSKYMERFVKAAMRGMPDALRQKYESFQSQYTEESKELFYEEAFAEMAADIATGAISIENSGGSLAAFAMTPLINTMKRLGLFRGVSTASFTDFTTYVSQVAEGLSKGAIPIAATKYRSAKRVKAPAKPFTEQRMSPEESLSAFLPENSEAYAGMTMDEDGNFVFLHISGNEFDTIDPSKVGSNLATSGEERRQISAARTGVSMFYTAREDQDVSGQFKYHYIVNPSKVYNLVEDPDGILDEARKELGEMGVAPAQNTLYARATKIANERGFDLAVMPWKEGKYKAQTTKKLPVKKAEKDYDSNRKNWNSVTAVSKSTAIKQAIRSAVSKLGMVSKLGDSIRSAEFYSFEDKFSKFKSVEELISTMENSPEASKVQDEINALKNAKDQSGYSERKSENIERVLDMIQDALKGLSEGFSIDPVKGEHLKSGVAVGDGKGEVGFPYDPEAVSEITKNSFRDTLKRALRNPIAAIGGWYNPDTKKFYLDVSEIYPDEGTAIRLGRERSEYGVYNIGTNTYIETTADLDRGGRGDGSMVDEVNNPQENSILLQKGEIEEIAEALGEDPDYMQATINTPTNRRKSSLINKNTKFSNLAKVIEDFKEENGRAPVILFWMGDQTGRGDYITQDGTKIKIEGGVSYTQDPKNKKKDVVWASHKTDNEIQGLIKDADIVAIVSGHPETGHRFYKGTSVVFYTEYMESVNKMKGQTIEYKAAPKKGGDPVTIKIPKNGYADPLHAIRDMYVQLGKQGKAPNTKDFKKFMEATENKTLSEFLAESEGERMEGVTRFVKPTKEFENFVSKIGMRPLGEIQDGLRDGYITENGFDTGDIYAFYKPARDENGRIKVKDGSHGTYGRDIYGEFLGVANRKDNIYDMAPIESLIRERELSGDQKLDVIVQSQLKDKQGELVATAATVEEINSIENENARNKRKSSIIGKAAKIALESGDTIMYQALSSKSGFVVADEAASYSMKRIVSDAGTAYDGDVLLQSLKSGLSVQDKIDALDRAAAKIKKRKGKEIEIKKSKEVSQISLAVSIFDLLRTALKELGGDFDALAESINENTRRKATPVTFKLQAGVYRMVANAIKEGKTKKQIIQDLKEAGFTQKDADLIYAKAAGYNTGKNAGIRAGSKARSKEYAERRKKELREEREEAKALRKRAKELFNREKRVTDAMVEEVFNYVKGLKGVNIKLSQMKTIIRLMKSANRKVYGNGAKTHRNYAVFLSFVDAVAKIIDKQVDAKQMEDHAKLLRSVNATQKKLALRVKKMNKVSRSPLASYIEQVENLTSIDAGLLTFETLQSLSSSLNALQNTTKAVGARIQGEEATLTKPYVYLEEIDAYIDTRTAKVYFDEMYASIKNEADQRQEALLIEQAMNIAFEDGTDWYTAYQELLRKKDLTVIQKKLEAIAEEMDLDMDNVQDLEAVLELYEEQQKENKSKIRKAIIQDAVLPTFQNWKTLLLTNEDFAKIFGYDSELSEEAAMELVEQRVNRLTLTELKKLEFFMFDFIANGKTYGLQALSAAAEAKNEGNNRLRKLNMEASTTAGVAKNLRNGYFNLFENTPTFFRRIFKRYSQAKVAQYMNAIGFGGLRNSAAQAEARSATFVQAVQNMLKNKNLNNIKSQTEMLVYSVLSQKPEGVSAAAWVVNLKASLKLSLENDTRLTDEQKKEVQTVLDMLESAGSMESVMSKLEANEDLMFGIDFLRKAFKSQEAGIKDYAESFLGMQFRSEDNYLPMNFRAVGSNAENLQELADRVENVGKAFKSHARTKAQAVAGAVYERNENALRSDKRYIDINFFASIERTYKENEIKVATARDVAYVSAMTSESNKDFANSVPDAGTRAQIRKKIYNYLVNASDYQQADEVLGKHGRSFVNYATNLTVVAYFGATIEQIVKQSSALMNAMIEARSMAARIHYVNTIIESITPEFARGEEGFKVTNAKRKLMSKFGISNRDVVSETLSVVGGKKIGEKTRFEKGVELSTAALRGTDKMAATATWIAYYVDYLVSEEGVNPDDINWETEAENPNNDAAQFADQMTIKDQNINSRRDKSRINEMTRGQALNIVKMIAMPFANFLLNKKINLSLDFQKVTMGDKKNRLEGLRSIAGTVAEVSAFQGATWMVLAPLYSVIGSALFGGDDEEESWWDKNFGKKMFKRGFFLDMNPLVVPIAAVENYMVRGINMAEYMLTEDPDDFNFADEEWSVGFERWEKLNGLPIFSSAGRGDLNVGGALGMLGVTGSVLNEIRLSMKNMVTLGQNEPFYTNRNGKERFVSREDAEQMQLIETMRTVMNAVMMVTGLQSKELAKITKSAKRPIEKRSTTDKESWIAKEIMNDASVGIDDMLGYLTTEIEGDPMNAGRKIDQIIKKAKGSMVDDFVSGANINTLRLIDKSEASNRGRAVLIHQIAETMTEAEAKQFYLDSYMYFGIKYGVETVKAQIFSDIMKYE